MTKVAIVTGSNKGIGFATVRGLCKQFDGDVYLLSRDVSRGEAAVSELNKEGLQPKFHQLDIEDKDSIEKLKTFLVEKYGGLDILVNNAATAFKNDASEPFAHQAEIAMCINFFGTLDMLNAMIPILKAGARVVNVSSILSQRTINRLSPDLKSRMLAFTSVDEASTAMQDFVRLAKAGTFKEHGWVETAYGTTKVGVSLLTSPLQRQLTADTSRPDIIINAVCPGFTATDLTSHKATRTADEGADSILYCALLPSNTEHPKGEFVQDRKIVDWTIKVDS